MSMVYYHETHSGERIAFSRYGSPSGHPVFYFHGSPGSRLELKNYDGDARELGLQIVSIDRPGMGQSDFCGDYSLLDHAYDVLEVADALGLERFSICGLSGGATTLYSVAHIAPDRVLFAVDVAGWAPVAEYMGLKSSMTPLDKLYLWIAQHTPRLFSVSFRLIKWAAVSPTRLLRVLSTSFSDADRAWLAAPDNLQSFQESLLEAFNQGVTGAATDARLRYSAWGFDLAEIAIPIHIFHGTDDLFAPHSFALWKRDRLSRACLMTLPSAGHLEMMSRVPALIAQVIADTNLKKE